MGVPCFVCVYCGVFKGFRSVLEGFGGVRGVCLQRMWEVSGGEDWAEE